MDGSWVVDERGRKPTLRRRSEETVTVTEEAVGRKGTCELTCLHGSFCYEGSEGGLFFVFHVPVSRSTSTDDPRSVVVSLCLPRGVRPPKAVRGSEILMHYCCFLGAFPDRSSTQGHEPL